MTNGTDGPPPGSQGTVAVAEGGCAACGTPVGEPTHRIGTEVFCSDSCAHRWVAHAGWATPPGESDIDPVGSTPPALPYTTDHARMYRGSLDHAPAGPASNDDAGPAGR